MRSAAFPYRAVVTTTLYRGGTVLTPDAPDATSILVSGDRVAWVGGADAADGLAGAADAVVELDGALVTPGFVDAHVHALESGLALDGVDLAGARGVDDVLARVRDAVRGPAGRRAAADGAPLAGSGWDDALWPEDRPPRRDELDAAGGGAPVWLGSADRTAAVVSSSFARVLGLDTLPGWRDDGVVTGEALRVAWGAVREAAEPRRAALEDLALRAAARAGVVAVHEHSAPGSAARRDLAALLARTAEPGSGLPQVAGYRAELCETTDDARDLLEELPGLRGIGGDLAVDGTLRARTAALRQPYDDVRGPGDRTGELLLTAEQVSNHVAAVTRAGVQAAFRVTGDRAVAEVLLGFRAAAEVEGVEALRAAGHRLGRASMLDAPALATLVLLGLTVAVEPVPEAAWGGDDGPAVRRLGSGRAASLQPLADLRAAGVPLAFGSGGPLTPAGPWAAVRAAVRHRTPDQRIPLAAAVHAHTRGGWLAAGLGDEATGTLRVGAPAHLAVWRTDGPGLPALGPQDGDPVCVLTVRAGRVLFDASGGTGRSAA